MALKQRIQGIFDSVPVIEASSYTPEERMWIAPYTRTAMEAAQNVQPSNYNALNSGPQLAPVTGAILALTRVLTGSTLALEERKGGKWENADPAKSDVPYFADNSRWPCRYQTRAEMLTTWAWSMLAGGNGYFIALSERDGYPNKIASLPGGLVGLSGNQTFADLVTSETEVMYTFNGKPYEALHPDNPSGTIAHSKLIPSSDILLGKSPLEIAAPAFRIGVAADAQAELCFDSGGMPPAILAAMDPNVSEQTVTDIMDHFEDIRKNPEHRHYPLAIQGDWKLLATHIDPEKMQLLDARKFTYSAASAVYGVPLPMLAHETVTTWGAGLRQLQRYFVAIVGVDFNNRAAEMLSAMLPSDFRVIFDPDHLLVGEPLERARYYLRLIQGNIIRPSEARAPLGFIEDKTVDQLQLQPVGDQGGDSDSGRDYEPNEEDRVGE